MPGFHRLKVLRRLPHPGRGFTQGLLTDDGTAWESTGPPPANSCSAGKAWRSLYHVRLIEGRRHKHPERLLTAEWSVQELFRKA